MDLFILLYEAIFLSLSSLFPSLWHKIVSYYANGRVERERRGFSRLARTPNRIRSVVRPSVRLCTCCARESVHEKTDPYNPNEPNEQTKGVRSVQSSAVRTVYAGIVEVTFYVTRQSSLCRFILTTFHLVLLQPACIAMER